MSKLFKELWHTITHSYHPERHYMRGHVEADLATSSDICDLQMKQKKLAKKGLLECFHTQKKKTTSSVSLDTVSVQYSHLYAVLH